ncbi:MAG: ABC transporter permease [Clostridiales bacterium]|jgi:putative ABC transport system permease protein|nr:ABC transporter permease [Clostridiales bacterium]
MDLFETARSALASVFGNKMRSILTMLGIIIGISSVIMITSIGNGFQQMITGEFESMGLNGVEIYPNYNETLNNSDLLTMDDVELIKQHPETSFVAPFWRATGEVALKNPAESEDFIAMGTTESYRMIQPVELSYGRFIAETDVERHAKVVLIDETLAREIFGRTEVVGETVRCAFWSGSVELTIIGVVKVEAVIAFMEMQHVVYMPITAVMDIYSTDTIDSMFVNVKDTEKISRTAEEYVRLLEISHDNEDKYRVNNIMQQMDAITNVFSYVTTFISFVAAISLLVGGIGVMNIMLVTVTERTREIGIRKALGATDGNISFQFLVEAIILTAVGGIIGIIVGYSGSVAIGNAIEIKAVLSIPMVIITVLISSFIGIIFGVYPARKASKMDPIDALRYE